MIFFLKKEVPNSSGLNELLTSVKGKNTGIKVTNTTDRLKHISQTLQGSTDSLGKCEREGCGGGREHRRSDTLTNVGGT